MYSNLNPKYIVSTIPAPVPTAYLQNYVSIRLLALRTNPDSFSSTHERESAFSTDEWRSRIDPSNRVTFFATQVSAFQFVSPHGFYPPLISKVTRTLWNLPAANGSHYSVLYLPHSSPLSTTTHPLCCPCPFPTAISTSWSAYGFILLIADMG